MIQFHGSLAELPDEWSLNKEAIERVDQNEGELVEMLEITNLEDIGSLKTGTDVKQHYGVQLEGKFDCASFSRENDRICKDAPVDLHNEAKDLVFKQVIGVQKW